MCIVERWDTKCVGLFVKSCSIIKQGIKTHKKN